MKNKANHSWNVSLFIFPCYEAGTDSSTIFSPSTRTTEEKLITIVAGIALSYENRKNDKWGLGWRGNLQSSILSLLFMLVIFDVFFYFFFSAAVEISADAFV